MKNFLEKSFDFTFHHAKFQKNLWSSYPRKRVTNQPTVTCLRPHAHGSVVVVCVVFVIVVVVVVVSVQYLHTIHHKKSMKDLSMCASVCVCGWVKSALVTQCLCGSVGVFV